MLNLNLRKEQFGTARQTIQSRYVKIELLNFRFQTIDSIEGVCISGNISINANSDIRRTGSIVLEVQGSSFDVGLGGKIFLDKYLRVQVGTYNLRNQEISWTNCGLFIIDAPNYHYNASNNTLTISLLDMMAKLTGVRNGYLKGIPVSFKEGESIRDAIISVLQMAGFDRYIVDNPPEPGKVPFDIEFTQGATVYDLLKGLVDLYPDYEMFFDINGTFIYQKMPTGNGDPILIDDTLWDDIVTDEDISVDFQNVKNSIEIYGRVHNPAYFSTSTIVSDSLISLTIPEVTSYSDGVIYGFTIKDGVGYSNMNLKINDLEPFPITLDDGETNANILPESGEVYYCIQFKGRYWNWLGHLQAYAFLEDTNKDSPFYVEGTVGRIRLPLFDGVYDNIFSDDLAQQRAKYELYLHSNMNDTVKLNCVPVYWIDVNILIEYTLKRNKQKQKFIIKSIDMGLAPTDTMTISMMRFYPALSEDGFVEWNSSDTFLEWNKETSKNIKWNEN